MITKKKFYSFFAPNLGDAETPMVFRIDEIQRNNENVIISVKAVQKQTVTISSQFSFHAVGFWIVPRGEGLLPSSPSPAGLELVPISVPVWMKTSVPPPKRSASQR